MKVKIKDLHPNPFRDMEHYPINPEKIESLKNSINQTGFWDNILARKKDDKIEIAYGHHRLMVLQGLYKPDDAVDIPIKDLDDATMIKIMANENDESWGTNPKVIDETVRVTKKFLEEHPEITKELQTHGFEKQYSKEVNIISNFLDGNWNKPRVRFSLDRLGLIQTEETNEKHVDKEAIESLPTERSARDFARAIKRVKNVTPEQQRKAAKKIIETQDFGEESVEYAVLEEKYKFDEKEKKEKKFEDFIKDCGKKVDSLKDDIKTLLDFKEDFDSEYYKRSFERWNLLEAIESLLFYINKLNGEKNETTKKEKNIPAQITE